MNQETSTTKRRIATYGRVSTGRQEDEETIKTQLSAVKEYAEKHDYEIVVEYKDEGWSGDILARPGLDQLRADARKGLWTAVLIYDPDRLARRYFYQELVIDELREAGIETLFVTMPPVVNDEDKLMFGVRGVFAQYERMKIAERFRLGKVRKAKEGHIVASEAPYGYNLLMRRGRRGDPDFSETHYEVNEEEARVVRLIFGWVANEHLTLRRIVKRLQEHGIRPRWSEKGVWNTSTLSTLVRNRTYIGEGHYGSTYAVVPENPLKKDTYRKVRKSSRKIRPQEEWILVKVPAIFESDADRDLFKRAQVQLRLNFEMSQRNKKNHYLLAGKIRCVCGRSRAGEGPQRGKYLYYRCTGRVHSFPLPPACKEHGINASIADHLLWAELYRLITSGSLMMEQIRSWKSGRFERRTEPMVNLARMEKDVQKLKQQEDRYAEAYGTGVITVEKFQEYVQPIRTKIVSLTKQLATAKTITQEDRDDGLPAEHEVEEYARMVGDTLRGLNFAEKRAIVRDTIDRVIGRQTETGGELQVYGSIPLKNYVEFQTIDRDSWLT